MLRCAESAGAKIEGVDRCGKTDRGPWCHAFVETGFQFISNRHGIIHIRLS